MEVIYHYLAFGTAYCKRIESREQLAAFAPVAVKRIWEVASHLLRP
jgi:hypothetical protein